MPSAMLRPEVPDPFKIHVLEILESLPTGAERGLEPTRYLLPTDFKS
jgi:hypothetical protein